MLIVRATKKLAQCDAEPEPHARIGAAGIDRAALAFARFTDLKSTWFTSHSEDVADVAAAAATALGLDTRSCASIRRAGLLHDIGRVGVPTGIWDLPRALSPSERDRVRFHSLGAEGHETATGLLAAADMWCALTADRLHRRALTPAAARALMATAVAERQLGRRPVDALLACVDQPSVTAPAWPSRLTDREVEVLRQIAQGSSDRQIAADLGITTKTVAHHIQHVYDKIGVRSRAGATLFAVEHRLHR